MLTEIFCKRSTLHFSFKSLFVVIDVIQNDEIRTDHPETGTKSECLEQFCFNPGHAEDRQKL